MGLLQWNLVRVRVTLLYAVELGLGQRCTHWSDGTESHAFGRALMRSRHSRLHPDHRPHSTNYLRNGHSEREGRRVSYWGELSCSSAVTSSTVEKNRTRMLWRWIASMPDGRG
jgi:hypothetical protein